MKNFLDLDSPLFLMDIEDDFLVSVAFDWSLYFSSPLPHGYDSIAPSVLLSPFVPTLSLSETSPLSPFIPVSTLSFKSEPYAPVASSPKAEKSLDYKHGYNTTFILYDDPGKETPYHLSQLDPSKTHIFNNPNGLGNAVLVFSNGPDVVFYDMNAMSNGFFSGVVNRNIFVAGSGIGAFDLAQGNDTVYLYNSIDPHAPLNTTINFPLVNIFRKTIGTDGFVQGTLTFYMTPYDDIITVGSLTAISSGIGHITFNGGLGSNTLYMNTFLLSNASYIINANANSLNNAVHSVGISNFQNIYLTTGLDSMVTFARGVVNNGTTVYLLDNGGNPLNSGILVGSSGHDYFNLSNFVGFNRLVTGAGRDTVYGDIYIYDAIYGHIVNFDDWTEITTAKEDTIYAISSATVAIITFHIDQYDVVSGGGTPTVLIRSVDTLYLSATTTETVYTYQGSLVGTVNTVYGQSPDALYSGINDLPTTVYLNMQGTGNNAQNIPSYYGFGSMYLDTNDDVIYAAFLGALNLSSAAGVDTLYLYANTGMTLYGAAFVGASGSIATAGINTIYSMSNTSNDVFYYDSTADISSINKLGSGLGIFYGDSNALTLYANRPSTSGGSTLSVYGLTTFYLGSGGTTVYYAPIPNQSTVYAPAFYGGANVDVFYGSTNNDYIAAIANFTSINLVAGNNTLWYIPVENINTAIDAGTGNNNLLYVNNIGLSGSSGFEVTEYIGAANALGGANYTGFQSIYFLGSQHTIYHVNSASGTYLSGAGDASNVLNMAGTLPVSLYLGRVAINNTGLTVEGMDVINLGATTNDTVYVTKLAQTSYIDGGVGSIDSLYFMVPVSSLTLTEYSASDNFTTFANFSRVYLQNTSTFTLYATDTIGNTTFYAGSGQAIFQGAGNADVIYSNYANLTTPAIALVDFTIIRTGSGNDNLYANYVLQSQFIDMGGGVNTLYLDIDGSLSGFSTLYLSTLRNVSTIIISGGTVADGLGVTVYSLNATDISNSNLTLYGNMTSYTDTAYLSWAGFSFTASNLLGTFNNFNVFYLNNLGSTLTFTRDTETNPLAGIMIINALGGGGTYVDTTTAGSTLYVNAATSYFGGLALQGFGTLDLGSGNDVIYVASGTVMSINAGGGNDNRVYTTSLEGVTIGSVSNVQSLYGAGMYDFFTITDNNTLVYANSSYMSASSASSIAFTASTVSISVDSSNSNFTTVSNFSTVYMRGTDASVYYAGGSIYGTSLYATAANATFYGDNSGVSITLGGNPNAGQANVNGFSTITLGAGDDTVYLSALGSSAVALNGGLGNNIFYVLNPSARMDFSASGVGQITGTGAGSVSFSQFNTFYLGEGSRAYSGGFVEMSFYANTLTSTQTTVYLGNGDDNAYVSSLVGTLNGSVAVMDIAALYLGTGNDEVWFQGDAGQGYFRSIYGQSGTNTFYLDGTLPSNSLVMGGTGNDTFYLTTDIVNNAFLDGGGGTNTLYAIGVDLPGTAYTNFQQVITTFSPAEKSSGDIDFSLDWDMHAFYADDAVDYGVLNGARDSTLISYGQYGAMHVDSLSGSNLIMDVRGGIHDILTLTGMIEDSLLAGGSIGYNIKGYEILDMRGVTNNSLYFTDVDLFTMAKGSNTGTLTIYTNDIHRFYILDGDSDYTYSYNSVTGVYDIFHGDDVVHLILKGK